MAKYLEILFRFKFRFALLLVLLPAMAGAATIVLFPSYKATAQLWIDDPGYFGGPTPTGWSQYLTPAQNEQDGLVQLTATHAFQVDLYAALADSIPDPATRIAAINGDKLLILATGSHLIMISASCSSPPVCVALVSKTIEVLRTEQTSAEKLNAKAGVSFLTTQLQQATQAQSQAQDALRRYVVTHPGAKVDPDPTTIQDPQLAQLATAVQQANARVNDIQAQVDRDNSVVSTNTAEIASVPRVIDQPGVGQTGLLGDHSVLRKAGLAAGAVLALGLAYMFLLGWLDKTLRDPRDVEHRFKVRVVTTIPELRPSERF